MMTDLKMERIRAGIRQIEIAKLTGIDRSRLSLIENGWIDPKPGEIEKIQSVLKERNE